MELISSTTKSCETCLLRLSVQSYDEISLYPLDESGSRCAVNNTFLNYRARVISSSFQKGEHVRGRC